MTSDKEWRVKNREHLTAYMREYRKRPGKRERMLETQRLYRARNPDHKAKARAANRRLNYGITQDQFDFLLDVQGGCCAICGTQQPKGKLMWVVDHCHKTSRVRGILCQHCNTAIGMFQDNTDAMRQAIAYLERAARAC